MALLRLLLLRGRCSCWRRPAPPPAPAWARGYPRPGGGPLGAGRGLQVTGWRRRGQRSGAGRPRGGASPPPCAAGSAVPGTGRGGAGRTGRGGLAGIARCRRLTEPFAPPESPLGAAGPAGCCACGAGSSREGQRGGAGSALMVFKWLLASRQGLP